MSLSFRHGVSRIDERLMVVGSDRALHRLLTLTDAIIHGRLRKLREQPGDDQVTTYLDTSVLPTHDTACSCGE